MILQSHVAHSDYDLVHIDARLRLPVFVKVLFLSIFVVGQRSSQHSVSALEGTLQLQVVLADGLYQLSPG